jgi:hypothetical protein
MQRSARRGSFGTFPVPHASPPSQPKLLTVNKGWGATIHVSAEIIEELPIAARRLGRMAVMSLRTADFAVRT